MEAEGLALDAIADELGKNLDPFDLICHVAFDAKPLTRRERAENVKKRDVFTKYGPQARAVLDALLEKYRDEGVLNLDDANVLKVGQDAAGDWHAFESKGRSSTPNDEAKRKAKDQAQRLVQIGADRCKLHIGAITYFRAERLEFYWRDPDPDTEEPFKAELPEGAWRFYYEPALAISEPTEGKIAMQADGLAERGADVRVSIAPEIRESLEQGEWNAARSVAYEDQADLMERGFFPDGLSVSCGPSWREPFGKVPLG